MTQRIIISILFLVTVSLRSNNVSAGSQHESIIEENHQVDIKPAATKEAPVPVKSMPMFPAPKPEAPHGKAAQAPHMEELPHIHRYHKERVKKVKQHSKLWFLGQLIIVLCHLSMLVIAYLHVIH